MAGTYLNYPFDEEIFINAWASEPDPVKTALLSSGAMVNDALIASRIADGSNMYTVPFYDTIDGTPVNLDGATDITAAETSGGSQSGIVYGRAIGWTARDFVSTLSGNDPMGHIASSVARFWQKQDQKTLIGILGAIFGITGDAEWTKHSVDLGSTTATAAPIEATTINDVMTDTLGDNKSAYSLVIMHSAVAKTLENLQVLEFWKYTDSNGLQRPTNLASYNGLTVFVDDGVPTTAGDGDASDLTEYTTYILGAGAIRFAPARLSSPAAEVSRDPAKYGGQETLYTRIRQTIHPNGFSFTAPSSSWTESPTDTQLFASANWSIKFNAKAIPIARVITNG